VSSSPRVDIDGVSVSPEHYINGRRVASPRTFEDRSPLDWSWKLADVARGGAIEAGQAVAAAVDAFPTWSALSNDERGRYLERLADLIDRDIERIAHVECLDMAMLEESLRLRVIARGARNFRAYAQLAREYVARQWTSNGTANSVLRMPAGPTVVITPWNAPFMLSTWKCAPALAAGNTVVLKPAEWSPLSCSLLMDLVDEAGFPPGVFNVVQGLGEEVGVGKDQEGTLAAELDAAAEKAALMYDDGGQVCLAGTRLLVDETIRDHFVELFESATARHRLGDSRDESTTVSPLIHPEHLARVDGFVQRARANGDRVVFGGRALREGELWYEPTLIEPKSNDSEVVQREIFGPVLTLQSFESEDEAVRLANSTPYGLSAVAFTSSDERAQRLGATLRAGTIWVNCFLVRDLSAPFGGIGISGIGREGGDYALDFYSDLKTLQIKEGTTHG